MSNEQRVYLNGNGDDPRALVTIFLRGGADGLAMVAPYEDDDYFRARPRIALRSGHAPVLNDRFALNPELAPLVPLFAEGELAIFHGVGSEDGTRSHFEAQDLMEHGGVHAGGWLGRFLRYKDRPAGSALSAVAIGNALPESLRGAPSVTVTDSLAEFARDPDSAAFYERLEELYRDAEPPLAERGLDTLRAMERIDGLVREGNTAPSGVEYPPSAFGEGLSQIARLIKSRVGLEAATLDLGGWDSHLTQETLMNPLMRELAAGLVAFRKDLQADLVHTTVVVMTEFGRRVGENSAFGTDHGRGSVAFVLGGGVRGGRVEAGWRSLKEEDLEGPGDLPVTLNYRDLLAPILEKHGVGRGIETVFPDYSLSPVEVFA